MILILFLKAPKLKDANLSQEDLKIAYEQSIQVK